MSIRIYEQNEIDIEGLASSDYICQGKLINNQTITQGSDTLISFVDDIDPHSWWNPDTKRFQPNTSGYYLISLSGWWNYGSASTAQVNLQIRKNNSTVAILQNQVETSTGFTLNGTKTIYLNGITDYVDFTAYTGNATSEILQGNSSGTGTYFSAALLVAGQGPQGATGPMGPSGAIGDKGDTGATGPQGPQGIQGSKGDTGLTGPAGGFGASASYYSTIAQGPFAADTIQAITMNFWDWQNGITLQNNSQIKITNNGRYNIEFSIQLHQTNSSGVVNIWLNKNGVPQTWTNTKVSITSNNPYYVAAWNFFVNSSANDYYEIMWSSDDNHTVIEALGPTGSGSNLHPGVPSAIVTVNQVG